MVAPFEAVERTYPEVAPEPPLTGQSGHGLAAGATLFANALETGTDATDVDASKNLGSFVGNSPYPYRFAPLRYISLPLPTSDATAFAGPVMSGFHQARLRSVPSEARSPYGSPTVLPKPVWK